MPLHQCRCEDGTTHPCLCVRNDDHTEDQFDVPEEESHEASPVQTQDEEKPAEPEGITTTKSGKKK